MGNYVAKDVVLQTLTKIGYNKTFHVVFDKADGEERKMDAMMIQPDRPVFKEVENMAVIDIWKEAWRSFNVNRVKKIVIE